MKYLILAFLLITSPVYALNLSKSCLAYYKLDDRNTTTSVKDEKGVNSGTIASTSSTVTSEGKINSGFHFDGFVNMVNCGSDFIGAQPITSCAWIYPEGWGEGNAGAIVHNVKYNFFISATLQNLALTSDLITYAQTPANSIKLNQWQFVCVTRDINGVATFYINGEVSGTRGQDSGTPTVVGTGSVILGNRLTGSLTFDGYIDNMMIFNRVLTQQEITELYNNGNGLGSLSKGNVEER